MDFATRAWNQTFPFDPIVRSLLDTDFYKLLMQQFIWEHYPNEQVGWAVTNRTRSVKLARQLDIAQVREQLDHVRTLRFAPSEIIHLRGQSFYGQSGIFKEGYLDALRSYHPPEYELNETEDGQIELRFEGPWWQTTLWEIYALAILNQLRSRALMRDMSRSELDILYARAKVKLYAKLERLKELPQLKVEVASAKRRALAAERRREPGESGRERDVVAAGIDRYVVERVDPVAAEIEEDQRERSVDHRVRGGAAVGEGGRAAGIDRQHVGDDQRGEVLARSDELEEAGRHVEVRRSGRWRRWRIGRVASTHEPAAAVASRGGEADEADRGAGERAAHHRLPPKRDAADQTWMSRGWVWIRARGIWITTAVSFWPAKKSRWLLKRSVPSDRVSRKPCRSK